MKGKRVLASFLIFIMVCGIVICRTSALAANTKTKTRVINIVYDDSGSMSSNRTTSWSQAKYALEVFVAMMGTNDTVNIYPMSSYTKPITIKGIESEEKRVNKISQIKEKGFTPFDSLTTAGNALSNMTSDEKWLIVLTDGAFYKGNGTDTSDANKVSEQDLTDTVTSYASSDLNTNVAYVAIGSSATPITIDKSNYYPYETDDSSILQTVTEIATKVFNYQKIPIINTSNIAFNADIPLSKIVIFAQGENLTVGNVQCNDTEIAKVSSSVGVKITEQDRPSGVDNAVVASGLNGQVITYEAHDDNTPFSSGNYSFSCNASQIEVYCEPGINLETVLTDQSSGKETILNDSISSVTEGEKTVHIRMVNPLTGKEVSGDSSQLLKDAQLTFRVKDQNGNTGTYHDGDTVSFTSGSTINAWANVRFAGDIEKSSSVYTLDIDPAYSELQLALNIETPEEKYTNKNGKHFMFDCTQRGKEGPFLLLTANVIDPKTGEQRMLTDEEWKKGLKGIIYSSELVDSNLLWKALKIICRQSLDFDIQLGDEPSTYKLYLSGLTASGVLPNTSELTIRMKMKLDGVTEQGDVTGIVTVKPTGLLIYIGRLLIYAVVVLLLLLMLLMYLKKNKFDRNMYPNTTGVFSRAGVSIPAPNPPQVSRRKIKYRILPPWKAQERDITIKYPGYLDVPITFHCIATGNGYFRITNLDKFVMVQEHVRFDGTKFKVMKEQPFALSMNSEISIVVKQGNITGKLFMTFRNPKKR